MRRWRSAGYYSVIDVEVSEVIENVDIYKDEDLPETIDGLDDFNLHRFVEKMIAFEEKYDLAEDSMVLEVFDDEDGKPVHQKYITGMELERFMSTGNTIHYEEFFYTTKFPKRHVIWAINENGEWGTRKEYTIHE